VVRFFAIGIAIIAMFSAALAEDTVPPEDAYLEVSVAAMPRKPFEQEMVLLRVNGFYRGPISLEKLEQPDFTEFGWMNLGRDRWWDEMVGGRKLRRLERVIALFPKKPGRLEVGAFTHHLTLLGKDGKRFTHDIHSAPLVIETARKPQNIAWWFPARSVAVTDSWDRPPDTLAFGAVAIRTITLRAEGAAIEMLPPAPKMQGRGLIAFADPEERVVDLTPQGPIAQATWRWTVRILSPDTGPLETDKISWFDTSTAEQRTVEFAPQRVALGAAIAPPPVSASRMKAAFALPAALVAGLLLGLAVLLPGWRLKRLPPISGSLPNRKSLALRRAAARGDAAAAWRAARALGRKSETLDRAVFGNATAPADSGGAARAILRRTPTSRNSA
jgi:hypothetical protein